MTITHELKCWPEYFRAVAAGVKTFEVRKDDRTPRFEVGHTLRLIEWDPATGAYTGAELTRFVSYVLRCTEHLAAGYCVMGLSAHATDPAPVVVSQSVLSKLDEILNPTERTYHWLHPDRAHTIAFPQLSDREAAGRVRMLGRSDLDHEQTCMLARDRIMHLSELVEAARALVKAELGAST